MKVAAKRRRFVGATGMKRKWGVLRSSSAISVQRVALGIRARRFRTTASATKEDLPGATKGPTLTIAVEAHARSRAFAQAREIALSVVEAQEPTTSTPPSPSRLRIPPRRFCWLVRRWALSSSSVLSCVVVAEPGREGWGSCRVLSTHLSRPLSPAAPPQRMNEPP